MKTELNLEDVKNYLAALNEAFDASKERLCKLDSVVGDGDHGTTIARGIRLGFDKISEENPDSINGMFKTFAMTMISSMGGASGPIFGSLFQGMAVATKGLDSIDAPTAAAMVAKGLEKVQKIGKAVPGEKTMVDALSPAAEAMAAGGSLIEVIRAGVKAAEAGVEATKEMTAGKGRARYAGERGHGHADAGASSAVLILSTLENIVAEGA